MHFLTRYWCIEPTFIDNDRRLNGDYDAVNNANKAIFSQIGAKDRKTARSMIAPDYANRFIRQYIVDGDTATINF